MTSVAVPAPESVPAIGSAGCCSRTVLISPKPTYHSQRTKHRPFEDDCYVTSGRCRSGSREFYTRNLTTSSCKRETDDSCSLATATSSDVLVAGLEIATVFVSILAIEHHRLRPAQIRAAKKACIRLSRH